MSYVYKQEFADEFTVGFYAPDGLWHQDSKHKTREYAAERVHWLNGGNDQALMEQLTHAATRSQLHAAATRDAKSDQAHIRAMEQLAHAIRNMPHTVRMRP